MATTTPKLGLRKPDPTDLINVATDLNANFDKIDLLGSANKFKFFQRRAGNIGLSSVVWADIPTILATFDIVLAAAVGDVIETDISAWISTASGPQTGLDVHTIVAAAALNSFGSGGAVSNLNLGISSLIVPANAAGGIATVFFYTVVAGDITAGNVTLRCRYNQAAAGAPTLYATASVPFSFGCKNLGPPTP